MTRIWPPSPPPGPQLLPPVLWCGSGGLAHALAGRPAATRRTPRPCRRRCWSLSVPRTRLRRRSSSACRSAPTCGCAASTSRRASPPAQAPSGPPGTGERTRARIRAGFGAGDGRRDAARPLSRARRSRPRGHRRAGAGGGALPVRRRPLGRGSRGVEIGRLR